jgi:hypothetical protein
MIDRREQTFPAATIARTPANGDASTGSDRNKPAMPSVNWISPPTPARLQMREYRGEYVPADRPDSSAALDSVFPRVNRTPDPILVDPTTP